MLFHHIVTRSGIDDKVVIEVEVGLMKMILCWNGSWSGDSYTKVAPKSPALWAFFARL